MVRVFIVLSLLFSLSFADAIEVELKSILGQSNYISKKRFLNILFKDERKFYTGNRVDIHKILTVIKANNLLPLEFRGTKELSISFATKQSSSPLIFIKMIKDSLNELGYSTISTKKMMRDSSGILWKVTLKTSEALDPMQFADELNKQGCYITKIKRYSKTSWRYNIDIKNIDIVPKTTPLNKKIGLKKPLSPYWIDVENAKYIKINSSKANNWHPYIIFYDRNLNILDNITKERKSYNERLSIPRGTKYIKISDIYTLENIKRGLSIYISK